ncbi:unnamed protein product [Moneuplotes crassus]|uniref:Uncharacterized protein n=1 Tax=Euplotes crassus TaxID=5936 RepID=A0AAD1XK94_EUPCR|nr:unnamed protein product [Moneuplotes crassus]
MEPNKPDWNDIDLTIYFQNVYDEPTGSIDYNIIGKSEISKKSESYQAYYIENITEEIKGASGNASNQARLPDLTQHTINEQRPVILEEERNVSCQTKPVSYILKYLEPREEDFGSTLYTLLNKIAGQQSLKRVPLKKILKILKHTKELIDKFFQTTKENCKSYKDFNQK